MANPPAPIAPGAQLITFGTIIHYGLPDLVVSGIIIDSYKREPVYADKQEVPNQAGVVCGLRMADYRVNVSVEGRVVDNGSGGVTYTAKPGDVLEINGDKIVIESAPYSGSAKGFHTLSISGTAYSGIAALYPSGVTTGGV